MLLPVCVDRERLGRMSMRVKMMTTNANAGGESDYDHKEEEEDDDDDDDDVDVDVNICRYMLMPAVRCAAAAEAVKLFFCLIVG